MKPKVIQKFLKNPGNGRNYTLITASKQLPTDEEKNKALERDLEKINAGKIYIVGYDKIENLKEPSLFVTNIGLSNAIRLGNKYNQTTIIHNGKLYKLDKNIKGYKEVAELDSSNIIFGDKALDQLTYSKFRKKSSKRVPFALQGKDDERVNAYA